MKTNDEKLSLINKTISDMKNEKNVNKSVRDIKQSFTQFLIEGTEMITKDEISCLIAEGKNNG